MNSITTDVAIKQGMQVLIHSGVPVATTEQLAGYYGCTKNNIKKNYSCNAARFTEGKHYFVISGSVLKELKDSVTFGNSVDKRAPKLTLWTQRGAARHAKMLETDRAWEVFEGLEDCYFSYREKVDAPRKSKTTTDERTPLRDAVNMLVSKKHLMYPDAYSMIHQRFGIESIEDLSADQIPMAVEYVHRVILDGEFISKQLELPVIEKQFSNEEVCSLAWLWLLADKTQKHAEITYPALKQLESRYSGDAHDLAKEFKYWLGQTMASLCRETAHIEPTENLKCIDALNHLKQNQWKAALLVKH